MNVFFGIRRFDAVVALYIFGIMVAELMGAKTMPIATIGGLHLTASVAIFVMPLLFTLIDVVVELYSKERARSMVRVGLLIVLLQVLTAVVFTHLPSAPYFTATQPAYSEVFGISVRFGIASVVAFAASELLDVLVFARLRQRLHGRALWLRTNATNFLAQFVDSIVWTSLAFYSLHMTVGANVHMLLGIAIPYYLVRVAMSVCSTPLVYVGVRWLRPNEVLTAEVQA
jgi:queuosine precursor transporter